MFGTGLEQVPNTISPYIQKLGIGVNKIQLAHTMV